MPFHIRITPKSRRTEDEVLLDLSEEEMERRILKPYRVGTPIVLGGKTIPTNDIERIKISRTKYKSDYYLPKIRARRAASSVITLISDEWYVTKEGEDVTDKYITGSPGFEKKITTNEKEMSGDRGNPISKQIKILSITVIFYLVVGTFLNAYSVIIYDYFDNDFTINPYYPDKELTYSIHNKAFLSLPMVNSYYFLKVDVMNGSRTYAWLSGGAGIHRNFTDIILDVGVIKPSESYNGAFYMHLNEENITFKFIVYLDLFRIFRLQVSSRIYLIQYLGADTYQILEHS